MGKWELTHRRELEPSRCAPYHIGVLVQLLSAVRLLHCAMELRGRVCELQITVGDDSPRSLQFGRRSDASP